MITKIFDICKQHTQDDLSYLREIVEEVKKKTGVRLEWEIKRIGNFEKF